MTRVGDTIAGKYRIIAPIGAGGMGHVYAARHLQLDTPLALKFLSDTTKGSVERFLREAKASAALKSEHVCRVSDFGIDDGAPYIVMELLDGDDLAGELRGGKLDVATAVDYLMQACIGIAEAHASGIVHRDLKPGNLFLTHRPDGSPLIKVLDFGVAKIPILGNVSLTQTANVIGSPAYMSPEQLRSSRSVDARSDVWALGVILYELVSDRHPFEGDSLTDLAVAIAVDPHAPLVEAPELEGVIARCLAKDPGGRYSDVASLVTALAKFTTKHPHAADVASRILYGTVDRPTVPRVPPTTEPPTVDQQPRTVKETPRIDPGESAAATTMQRSTGEIGRRPTRRLGVSIAVAIVLIGAGVSLALMQRRSEEPAQPVALPAPPPTAPPPAPEAPKTGRLIVTVQGADAGTIFIDGKERGRGERIEDELSIGPHEIELRVPDREPIRQPVDVHAGMISSVAIVVPAAPTAPPVVAVEAKTSSPRKPRPAIEKPTGKGTFGFALETAPPAPEPVEPAVAPTPHLPACSLADRLPSGGCPPQPVCSLVDRLPSGGCPPPRKHKTLDKAAMTAGLRTVWLEALQCAETEPGTRATGRVVVRVKVRPDGQVASSAVAFASDPDLGLCIAGVVHRATFKATTDGGVFEQVFNF